MKLFFNLFHDNWLLLSIYFKKWFNQVIYWGMLMFSAKILRQPSRAKTANKLRSAGFVVFCLRGSEAKSEKRVFVKIFAGIWLFHKFWLWGRQDVVLHGRSELFSLPVFARIRILPFSFCLWTRITHFAIKYQRRSRTTKVRKMSWNACFLQPLPFFFYIFLDTPMKSL